MPLKVRVTPTREGGGRVMSATDASTAKSTTPKKGMEADLQRLINSVKANLPALKKAAPNLFGSRVSDKDKEAMKKAKKDPKNYEGKAYGGKTYSNGVRKPAAMGGKARKK